jgi:hypothetical protein
MTGVKSGYRNSKISLNNAYYLMSRNPKETQNVRAAEIGTYM